MSANGGKKSKDGLEIYGPRKKKKQGDKQTAVLARNGKQKQVSVYASCDSAATNCSSCWCFLHVGECFQTTFSFKRSGVLFSRARWGKKFGLLFMLLVIKARKRDKRKINRI